MTKLPNQYINKKSDAKSMYDVISHLKLNIYIYIYVTTLEIKH